MSPDLLPLVLVAPLLVAMGYCDLKAMRIPNRLVIAMVVLFVLIAPFALAPIDIFWRLLAAGIVLLVSTVGFVFGILAGGDVKGLSALILFVPPDQHIVFAFIFSAAMLSGLSGVLLLRRGLADPDASWAVLADSQGFPMGVSIALAGLIFAARLFV